MSATPTGVVTEVVLGAAASPGSLHDEPQGRELAGAVAQDGPVTGNTTSCPVKLGLQRAGNMGTKLQRWRKLVSWPAQDS